MNQENPMTERNEDRIVKIAEGNILRLENEIAKLNRRADKIDCPHIRYEILETNMVPDPYKVAREAEAAAHYGRPINKEKIDSFPKIKQHTIEIIGDGPKIEGWKFVGTLDHYSLPGKVIVNTVPGETVPETYYDHAAICDHCEKIRRRVETFVLEGTDENEGNYMLVGRNCLKDFFGHDAMYVVRFLNRIWKLVEGLDDEDEWGRPHGERYVEYINSMKVLTTTVACIRSFGWVAASSAGYDQIPTSAHVRRTFTYPTNEKEREAHRKFLESIKYDDDADLADAEGAIEWLKEQEADNEYMHNLKLLQNEDVIPAKMLGYWCSLIAAYQRHLDRLERQKRLPYVDDHFGTEGERTEIRVRCLGVHYTDGYYGTIAIHRMRSSEGHTLVWFANSDAKMTRGNDYQIRARIKQHGEYNSKKQTVLSRVFVIEEFENEEGDG
jgi:hypothetical protein